MNLRVFRKIIILVLVLLSNVTAAFATTRSCRYLFGKSINVRTALMDTSISNLIPSDRMAKLDSAHWYQYRKKSLLKKLSLPIEKFKGQNDFEQFSIDLTDYLYPNSLKNDIFAWHETGEQELTRDAKKRMVQDGIIKTLKNSKITLKEKSNLFKYLGAAARLTVGPFSFLSYFSKELSVDDAQNILLNGADDALRNSPDLAKRLSIKSAEKYLNYFFRISMLTFALLVSYNQHEQEKLATENLKVQLEQRLDAIDQSQKETNILLEVQQAQYRILVADFKAKFLRVPTDEEDVQLRRAVLPAH